MRLIFGRRPNYRMALGPDNDNESGLPLMFNERMWQAMLRRLMPKTLLLPAPPKLPALTWRG